MQALVHFMILYPVTQIHITLLAAAVAETVEKSQRHRRGVGY